MKSYLPGIEYDISQIKITVPDIFSCGALLDACINETKSGLVELFCDQVIIENYQCTIDQQSCEVTNYIFKSKTGNKYTLYKEVMCADGMKKYYYNRLIPVIETIRDHVNCFNEFVTYKRVVDFTVLESCAYHESKLDGTLHGYYRTVDYNYLDEVSSINEEYFVDGANTQSLSVRFFAHITKLPEISYSIYQSCEIYKRKHFGFDDLAQVGIELLEGTILLSQLNESIFNELEFKSYAEQAGLLSYSIDFYSDLAASGDRSYYIGDTLINDTLQISPMEDDAYRVAITRKYTVGNWEVGLYASTTEINPTADFSRPERVLSKKLKNIIVKPVDHRSSTKHLLQYDIDAGDNRFGLQMIFPGIDIDLLTALKEIGADPFHLDEITITTLIMKYSDMTPADIALKLR